MVKSEAPFVRGTPEEAGMGNRIHTLNTLTSDSQGLLLVRSRDTFVIRLQLHPEHSSTQK